MKATFSVMFHKIYVSHVNMIYGDCYISDIFFLHSIEDIGGITYAFWLFSALF